jgi:hypothetical protein
VVELASHLLRQMMSAEVVGSFAGFFCPAEVPLEVGGGGGGVLEALPLVAASAFFLRAIGYAES